MRTIAADSKLTDMGVLVESEVPALMQKKTDFFISSAQPGEYKVLCNVMGKEAGSVRAHRRRRRRLLPARRRLLLTVDGRKRSSSTRCSNCTKTAASASNSTTACLTCK